MIKLEKITKIYKNGVNENPALKDVDLTVEDGEYISIMGASGSGKSTLLNIIGCMDRATSGSYFYGDTNVTELSKNEMDKFRKEHIGFVFQSFALLNHYTVYENVEIPLLALNVKRSERREKIMAVLKQLGIDEFKDQRTNLLSGGQQQRCAIARALVTGADLILADEPTGALDKKNGGEIVDLFQKINEEGRTVILITHDPEIAQRSKRIIHIEDGKIV